MINILLYRKWISIKFVKNIDTLNNYTWLPSFLSKHSTLGIQEHAVLKEIVDFSFC